VTEAIPADPPTPASTVRAAQHAPLPAGRAERWAKFGRWEEPFFPTVVGLQVDEVRLDYARLRLPFRPELRQPAGAVHGGAIATMIDTVAVPAIGGGYDRMPGLATIDMQIRYLGAARDTDLVAEGWVVKRGRSIVFCQAEVRSDPGGELIAEGWTTFRVVPVD
jgi:uncharacterized protein (TIGR00369 family)